MQKVIKLNGKDLDEIQDLINLNPSWKLVACGTTEYQKSESVRLARYTTMVAGPKEKKHFAVFETGFNYNHKAHQPFLEQ